METFDSTNFRRLFKFLDHTKLNVPLILVIKGYLERFMGNGFKFKRLNMIAVGQSHLDAAWRWRKKQTVLKAKATFTKAIQHMKEHPLFSYAQPSPAYYEWMKKFYPAFYEEMKVMVKRGQWVLIGGMWIEPDLNLPSGESLVRQRLVGMRYFLDEFGHVPELEFLQDVFGFCYSLPQILAKSGAKMFGTGKLFWNDTNKFPIGMFHWRSPDGTTIPTLLMNFGYFLPVTYGKDYPNIYQLMKGKTVPGVSPVFEYTTPIQDIRAAQSRDLMTNTLFGYGLGDGGHGPVEAEIMAVDAIQLIFPKTFRFYRQGMIYPHFKPTMDRWATWNDELYLEMHRGVYTTNAKMKKYNRTLEILLEDCEKACALAAMAGLPYPREELLAAWKIVLFNQFHDILPGSSIYQVYVDAFEDYERAKNRLDRLLAQSVSFLGALVNPSQDGEEQFRLSNFLGWPRTEVVEIDAARLQDKGLDPAGLAKRLGGQVISTNGKDRVLVPSMIEALTPGVTLREAVSSAATDEALAVTDGTDAITLENRFLLVEIDKATGYIQRVYLKGSQFEALSGQANRILLFQDHPKKFDAWEIDTEYMKKPIQVDDRCTRIEIVENGPVRCGVQVEHVHEKSRFIQRIYLHLNDELVRCSMDVDWHQEQTLFKLAFPFNVQATKVAAEIPYATISRPTKPVTKREKARWEYSCQRWLDVSDGTHGVGIVNNCKYGFNALGSEIRLTMLNGPVYAGYAKETMFVERNDTSIPKFVDQFFHEDIRYALYPHAGTWQDGTWKKGIEFNDPVKASFVEPPETQPRSGAAAPAAMSCTPESVQLAVVKVHEDEKDLEKPRRFTIRLVEMSGRDAPSVEVRFPPFVSVESAREIDLLELKGRPSMVSVHAPNSISTALAPFEIKTVEVMLGSE
jgi:alpha-mannosidase